jgi:hypothetical protein
VSDLDGVWLVRRTGGALPPLFGMQKRIDGPRGTTVLGPLRLSFRVEGLNLRYDRPFGALVDVLEPDGDGFRGRATVARRTVGTFELRPEGGATGRPPLPPG